MRTVLFTALMIAFAVTTLPYGAEDAGDCDDCASHASPDACCPKTQDHAHGDKDDNHDGPDSPCSHEKDYHCCCGHVQAMIGTSASELLTFVVAGQIVIAPQTVSIDPSQRQTFHIPIA